MRKRIALLTLAITIGSVVYFWEDIYLFAISRKATNQECAILFPRSPQPVFGHVHRWKDELTPVGRWVMTFPDTPITQIGYRYSREGEYLGHTLWSADGTLVLQLRGSDHKFSPPWWWDESDQDESCLDHRLANSTD